MIQDKIENCKEYIKILKYLKDKKEYKFSCTVNSYKYGRKDFETFTVNIILSYKNRNIEFCSFMKKIKFDSDINNILINACLYINNYFNTLNVIRNVDEIDNILEKFNNKYKDFNIDVNGELLFEDVYLIEFTKEIKIKNRIYKKKVMEYYVFSDCIAYDIDKNEVYTQIANINDVSKYINNSIDEAIKKETEKRCYECDEKFTLELGELKFFINKGFDLPKRCKHCRSKRKQNKQN